MSNRAVKFLLAVSAGVVASAPVAMIPLSVVGATEECLTTPKDEATPGKHWYYRIERGTKRHCWYLRNGGETSSQAAPSTSVRRAAPEVAPIIETKLAGPAADAHAELPSPQTIVEADLKSSQTRPATSVDPRGAEPKLPNNATPETAQSPVASRWPQPMGVVSSTTERPMAPSFVVASASNLDASADADLTPIPPVASKVRTSATGTAGSLQLFLLGTFGAIALSWWFAGHAIYQMAKKRRRQRYTSLHPPGWPADEPTSYTGIPPWLEPVTVNSTHRIVSGRDAGARSLDGQRSGSGDDAREIEQLLEQFANKAQAGP